MVHDPDSLDSLPSGFPLFTVSPSALDGVVFRMKYPLPPSTIMDTCVLSSQVSVTMQSRIGPCKFDRPEWVAGGSSVQRSRKTAFPVEREPGDRSEHMSGSVKTITTA